MRYLTVILFEENIKYLINKKGPHGFNVTLKIRIGNRVCRGRNVDDKFMFF